MLPIPLRLGTHCNAWRRTWTCAFGKMRKQGVLELESPPFLAARPLSRHAGVGPIGTNTLFSESFRHTPTGAILGGQLGYNWQIGSAFLLGLEADWQGAWQKDTATVGACNSPSTPGFFAGPLVASIFGQRMTDEQKLTNFGTLRGRGSS
jgi:hypothetical protein